MIRAQSPSEEFDSRIDSIKFLASKNVAPDYLVAKVSNMSLADSWPTCRQKMSSPGSTISKSPTRKKNLFFSKRWHLSFLRPSSFSPFFSASASLHCRSDHQFCQNSYSLSTFDSSTWGCSANQIVI